MKHEQTKSGSLKIDTETGLRGGLELEIRFQRKAAPHLGPGEFRYPCLEVHKFTDRLKHRRHYRLNRVNFGNDENRQRSQGSPNSVRSN